MNPVADAFKDKGWVYLSGVLDKQACSDLTNHLFELSKEGKLEQDDQCPLSESIYNDVYLKQILNNLAEPLSDQLGIKLLPAYCYSRIYKPGETLEWHTDRPACEISGTLTLGHAEESRIWPIYFGKDMDDRIGEQVQIDVGDMVMYRGEELPHWRTTYKGKWQTQVFFHFVDAEGQNAGHAGDLVRIKGETTPNVQEIKRPTFVIPPREIPQMEDFPERAPQPEEQEREPFDFGMNKNIIEDGIMIRRCDDTFPGIATLGSHNMPSAMLTPEECQSIIESKDDLYEVKGTVGAGDYEGTYAAETRTVDVYNIPLEEKYKWIYTKIAAAAEHLNKELYKFDLLGITHSLQLLHYKEGGHYDWHIDAGAGQSATRKLSVVIQLSDPSSYEGGKLEVNNNGNLVDAIMERGAITTFPSFCLHKVHPVTKGERWTLVIWIHGPDRFK